MKKILQQKSKFIDEDKNDESDEEEININTQREEIVKSGSD
jgi:hypothetical protein